MITIDDVATFATSLPDVTVTEKWGNRTWTAGSKFFAWQRPFSKADIKRFGDEKPPEGDILAVIVENLDAKDALLSIALPGFFTIPHFDGFAAVLIQLKKARAKDVRAAIRDAHRTAMSKATTKRIKRASRARGRAPGSRTPRSRSR
jgi:hypothetical protein